MKSNLASLCKSVCKWSHALGMQQRSPHLSSFCLWCIYSTTPTWIVLFLSLYLPLLKFANALECEAVACNSSLCSFVCEKVGSIFNLHWQALVSTSSNPFYSTNPVSYVLLNSGMFFRRNSSSSCCNGFLGAKLLLRSYASETLKRMPVPLNMNQGSRHSSKHQPRINLSSKIRDFRSMNVIGIGAVWKYCHNGTWCTVYPCDHCYWEGHARNIYLYIIRISLVHSHPRSGIEVHLQM